MVVARRMGRLGIGFDTNENCIKMAKMRTAKGDLFGEWQNPQIYQENALKLGDFIEPDSIDLCVTEPPRWARPKSGPPPDPEKGFHSEELYSYVYDRLKPVFSEVNKVLRPNKYCIVNLADLRADNRFIPVHVEFVNMMYWNGFDLEDIIIWDRRKDHNYLPPRSFSMRFVTNKIHEYLLVFKKIEKE